MWNTMECKRDSSNGSLGGASEIHWECVSHCLKALTKNQASTSVTGCTYTRSSLTISFYEISSGSLFTRLAIAIVVVFFFLLFNSLFFLSFSGFRPRLVFRECVLSAGLFVFSLFWWKSIPVETSYEHPSVCLIWVCTYQFLITLGRNPGPHARHEKCMYIV